MSTGWDSNMLKKLKVLIGKNLSMAEIGQKLGMSKNAVVGKLNRLGWNTKSVDVKPGRKKSDAKTTATEKNAKKSAGEKVNTKAETKKTAVKTATKKAVPVVTEKVERRGRKPKADKIVTKVAKKEPIVIKTASKKTKKDLALHELLIQHALQMASLKPNQCRWPIGDPDSDSFHFCGETVFAGKPYCYEHCRQAYQFTPPKKK